MVARIGVPHALGAANMGRHKGGPYVTLSAVMHQCAATTKFLRLHLEGEEFEEILLLLFGHVLEDRHPHLGDGQVHELR